jgi:hypothetical protein
LSKIANALLVTAALAAIGGFAATPAFADPAKPPPSTTNCFPASEWQGWKSPSPDVIYIRVRMHDVYRLDLSGGASDLDWPDVHLVTKFVGSDWVCSPVDLQLYAADDNGIREPLIVKAITKLTPEEIAAIPPKFRP